VQEEDRLVLSVSNDGGPLPESGKIRDGLGLRQMRMRTRLLGGTLSLHPGEGGHTLLQIVIPRSS
jgi:signal transduction histidine kinase